MFDVTLQHEFAFFIAQVVDKIVDTMDVIVLKTFVARVMLDQGLKLIERAEFQTVTDCRAWVMLDELSRSKPYSPRREVLFLAVCSLNSNFRGY